MRVSRAIAYAAAVLVALPAVAAAQQPTRRPARRTQAIEIRGQVPTPQVVTVRPREMPTYSRQVLVPNFYDHDFWQSILPGYQVVPRRVITGSDSAAATGGGRPFGVVPLDSAGAAEAAAIQRELEERRSRVNRLGAKLDTLYAPGGVKPSALDSAAAANQRLPIDTTARRPVQPDTTARPPVQPDTTTRRPPVGTAPATRQR